MIEDGDPMLLERIRDSALAIDVALWQLTTQGAAR
jgi:hypothetical protein